MVILSHRWLSWQNDHLGVLYLRLDIVLRLTESRWGRVKYFLLLTSQATPRSPYQWRGVAKRRSTYPRGHPLQHEKVYAGLFRPLMFLIFISTKKQKKILHGITRDTSYYVFFLSSFPPKNKNILGTPAWDHLKYYSYYISYLNFDQKHTKMI